MAKKRNYALNPPANLTELNKDSMLDYVIGLNDEKELAWFIDLLDNHKEMKEYKFDTKDGKHKKGDPLEGYNLPPIRKAFARHYFPSLFEKKTTKPQNSFEARLEEARKKINK